MNPNLSSTHGGSLLKTLVVIMSLLATHACDNEDETASCFAFLTFSSGGGVPARLDGVPIFAIATTPDGQYQGTAWRTVDLSTKQSQSFTEVEVRNQRGESPWAASTSCPQVVVSAWADVDGREIFSVASPYWLPANATGATAAAPEPGAADYYSSALTVQSQKLGSAAPTLVDLTLDHRVSGLAAPGMRLALLVSLPDESPVDLLVKVLGGFGEPAPVLLEHVVHGVSRQTYEDETGSGVLEARVVLDVPIAVQPIKLELFAAPTDDRATPALITERATLHGRAPNSSTKNLLADDALIDARAIFVQVPMMKTSF